MPEQSGSRRALYAELTRREVVRSARKLFGRYGYAQTTVESIARDAGVSAATVYAQCGGKEGLLQTLMDMWTTSHLVPSIIAECAAAESAHAKLDALARGYVAIYAESGDIIRIVTRAAAGAPAAEAFLKVADERQQNALRDIVTGLRDVGGLADGITVEEAVQIIFFHFRYAQFALAADEFGWGAERTTRWLTERVESAILKT
ncbi:TetR/AcrR family transcriptional regulator [Kribbella jejuensis]|uniref:TetR family transcriptional regulator n=1 Tax=Kribbella jejuensis TaxID=236068 RepID=A0A542DTC5_9ACTN|nr:TetR/AcrR family transcriptional regulator [Kribbella jejuensis]TQJ06347.1 TetR family transcriptional regulator [Kribbella jejuensis]